MLVLAAGIDVEVVEQLGAQAVLGEHALYHAVEQAIGTVGLGHDTGGRALALAAGVARVREVNAVGPFLTGQLHLVGIDDNHVVATVHVRGEIGFVLTAQQLGYFRAKASQHLVGSVDYDPFLVCRDFVRRNGLVT